MKWVYLVLIVCVSSGCGSNASGPDSTPKLSKENQTRSESQTFKNSEVRMNVQGTGLIFEANPKQWLDDTAGFIAVTASDQVRPYLEAWEKNVKQEHHELAVKALASKLVDFDSEKLAWAFAQFKSYTLSGLTRSSIILVNVSLLSKNLNQPQAMLWSVKEDILSLIQSDIRGQEGIEIFLKDERTYIEQHFPEVTENSSGDDLGLDGLKTPQATYYDKVIRLLQN